MKDIFEEQGISLTLEPDNLEKPSVQPREEAVWEEPKLTEEERQMVE